LLHASLAGFPLRRSAVTGLPDEANSPPRSASDRPEFPKDPTWLSAFVLSIRFQPAARLASLQVFPPVDPANSTPAAHSTLTLHIQTWPRRGPHTMTLFLPTVNSMRKPLLSAKVVIYSMMSIGFHQRSLRARRHQRIGANWHYPPCCTSIPSTRQQCRAGIFSPLPGPRPAYRTRQRAQEFRMALACSLSRLGLLRRPIFRLAATPYAGRLPSQQSQQLFLLRSSSPFFSAWLSAVPASVSSTSCVSPRNVVASFSP
jgi:hypothetical protein